MQAKAVFIVDDDEAVCSGLKFAFEAVGYAPRTFPSAHSFLETYHPEQGGCLVLDVQMPSMTGLELQKELNFRGWRLPVIFITGHATVPVAIAAIKAGAFDFIEKPWRAGALIDAVNRALHWKDTADEERLLRAQLQVRAESLTDREREVLALVAAGEQTKVIAYRLGISTRTVDLHRGHIIEKLEARGRSDLIRMALMLKL